MTDVEPHEFKPLRWWDKLSRDGRCCHCMLANWMHPCRHWVPARAYGDKSAPSRQYVPSGSPLWGKRDA